MRFIQGIGSGALQTSLYAFITTEFADRVSSAAVCIPNNLQVLPVELLLLMFYGRDFWRWRWELAMPLDR